MTLGSSENPESFFFFFHVLSLKSRGHIAIQWRVFNTQNFKKWNFNIK